MKQRFRWLAVLFFIAFVQDLRAQDESLDPYFAWRELASRGEYTVLLRAPVEEDILDELSRVSLSESSIFQIDEESSPYWALHFESHSLNGAIFHGYSLLSNWNSRPIHSIERVLAKGHLEGGLTEKEAQELCSGEDSHPMRFLQTLLELGEYPAALSFLKVYLREDPRLAYRRYGLHPWHAAVSRLLCSYPVPQSERGHLLSMSFQEDPVDPAFLMLRSLWLHDHDSLQKIADGRTWSSSEWSHYFSLMIFRCFVSENPLKGAEFLGEDHSSFFDLFLAESTATITFNGDHSMQQRGHNIVGAVAIAGLVRAGRIKSALHLFSTIDKAERKLLVFKMSLAEASLSSNGDDVQIALWHNLAISAGIDGVDISVIKMLLELPVRRDGEGH